MCVYDSTIFRNFAACSLACKREQRSLDPHMLRPVCEYEGFLSAWYHVLLSQLSVAVAVVADGSLELNCCTAIQALRQLPCEYLVHMSGI